jgi:mono/diheme cytochrome c family protein
MARGAGTLGALAALAVLLSACSAAPSTTPNLITGKQVFVAKCGSCHTLSHAGTAGTIGPNLDEAFAASIREAHGRSGIKGIVEHQIEFPNTHGVMPANLVRGQDVADVSAYVEAAAAAPGQDVGLLAEATKPKIGAGVAKTPELREGEEAFTGSAGCASCHTLADAGASGTVGPNLDQRLRADCETAASKSARGSTLEDCVKAAITSPYKYIPSGYTAGVMPADFGTKLTPKQLNALVAYLIKATEKKS